MKETNGINVLSLFNGLGGIGLALHELGIKAKIYSSEIDKYANKVSNALFKNQVNLGCVTKVSYRDGVLFSENTANKIDVQLIVFGSPCQGFSSAGNKLNFADPRSKLFFEALRILREIQAENPNVVFIMENVNSMDKAVKNIISKELGVAPIMINSNLVSAQNRERLYWTKICTKDGFFYKESDIKQPIDRRIFLKDILDKEVDEKYFLSDKMKSFLSKSTGKKETFKPADIIEDFESSKSNCLNARMFKMGKQDTYIKISKDGKVKPTQEKASCFTAGGNSGGNHSDMDLFIVQRGHGFNQGGTHHEKSPTLTSGKWESNNFVVQLNDPKSAKDRIYDVNYKAACVQTDSRAKILNDFGIRRLTPKECAKLQTIPDWAIEIMLNCGVSDTQLYKMLGNGFTIEVFKHILSHQNFKQCKTTPPPEIWQNEPK